MGDQEPFVWHVIVSNIVDASAHSTRSFVCTLYTFPRIIRSHLSVVFGAPHAKYLVNLFEIIFMIVFSCFMFYGYSTLCSCLLKVYLLFHAIVVRNHVTIPYQVISNSTKWQVGVQCMTKSNLPVMVQEAMCSSDVQVSPSLQALHFRGSWHRMNNINYSFM